MKKILFSLAALAALSMVAVGCKKASDAAKDKTPSAKEVVGQKQEAFYQAIGDTSKTKCTKEEAEDIVKKYNELKDAAKALTGDDKTKADELFGKLDGLVTVKALQENDGLKAVQEALGIQLPPPAATPFTKPTLTAATTPAKRGAEVELATLTNWNTINGEITGAGGTVDGNAVDVAISAGSADDVHDKVTAQRFDPSDGKVKGKIDTAAKASGKFKVKVTIKAIGTKKAATESDEVEVTIGS